MRNGFLRAPSRLLLAAAALAPALFTTAPAQADVPGLLTLMSTCDVLVLGNLSTSSDIEGRTFVGHDYVGTSSASFAIHLSTPATDPTFVVVHDLVSGSC